MKTKKEITLRKIIFFCAIATPLLFNFTPINGQSLIQYSNSTIENSGKYKDGNIYQKDFLLFTTMLEETHPAFAPSLKHPVDIDSIQLKGYQWADECQSNEALSVYIQSILTLLNDGHTTVGQNMNMNLIYPFSFFKNDQSIYLRGVNQAYKSSLGKEISQINGAPVLDVINSFKQVICADNEVRFFALANNLMPFYSMWKNNPYYSTDSILKVTFTDATTISLKPLSKQQLNIAWLQNKIQPNSIRTAGRTPFLYKIVTEKNICYLQFNNCIDQNTLRSQYATMGMSKENIEKNVSRFPIFDKFLDEMFQKIKEQNINTLVVDVQNNPGGNSQLCDELLSRLKPRNEIKQGTASLRCSKLWEQNLPLLAENYKQKFREKGEVLELGRLYENELLTRVLSNNNSNTETITTSKQSNDSVENKTIDTIYKGTVIFIQNELTYSSAGMLITNAVDNNIGIVIGGESSYSPSHYGDILNWELPNTKIKGTISHKIFYRPDISKSKERSLIPSIKLTPNFSDLVEGKDIYWEWILNNYKKLQP